MIGKLTKKQMGIIIVSAVAVLVIAGIVLWWFQFQSSEAEPDPYVTSQDKTAESVKEEQPPAEQSKKSEGPASSIDPATVSTVDIEPLGITVSYVKGIAGFEFYVQRTAEGTRYVEFRAPELAGTKCTGDVGVFASIVESPTKQDGATISQEVQVNQKTYGLSLPDTTCTANAELLARYQASFRDAFSLLTAL